MELSGKFIHDYAGRHDYEQVTSYRDVDRFTNCGISTNVSGKKTYRKPDFKIKNTPIYTGLDSNNSEACITY